MNDPQASLASMRKSFKESDDPVTPGAFYIQSNIGNSNWVVAATNLGSQIRVRLARKNGALGQLFLSEDDPRGGAYLKNVGTQRVLTWHGRGVECTLEPKDESDPHQLWVKSPWGSWNALYAANWNQALNVFGNSWDQNNGIGLWEFSGGQPNEIWQLNAENGAITVESMTYDMSRAIVSLDVPPSVNAGTAVDNTGSSIPMETTVTLERKMTSSHRISYDENSSNMVRTLTTIGFTAGFENIVEVKGSSAVETVTETKISYSDTSSQSTTIKDTIKNKVVVPPHAKFEFAILVHYGRVDVPYTAVIARALPGGGVDRVTLNGTFSNVTMVRYEIIGHDITDGMPKRVTIEQPATQRVTEPA